jgi:heat shock protein HslJ
MFKHPCAHLLLTIEVTCNEIFGNYTVKVDRLIIATFGVEQNEG